MNSRIIKNRIGLAAIVIVTLLPIFLWADMKPFALRFGDSFLALTSIGQVTALVGMTLFSVTMILSARVSFLEDYFGSLDRVYRIHHYTGTLGVLLIMVHPLALAVRLVPISVVEAAKSLVPGADWAINFGIFSILLFMLLLSITFYSKWRYQFRYVTHQMLGGAFFLGILHTMLIPSDISSNLLLRYFILSLAMLGLVAYVYRTILGKLAVKRYEYIVDAVSDLGQGITEVVMSPSNEVMSYKPGQFIFISFVDGGISKETHPYSISSAPTQNKLAITSKALGDWSGTLKDLRVGAKARIEGPFGAFSYLRAKNSKQIWVAGGIGITPFLNMARNLYINQREDLSIDFYYATRTPEEMVFYNELKTISEVYPNLRLIPHSSEEKGFLTADVIKSTSGGLTDADIFVCGPPPMMNSLKSQFSAAGIPKRFVHMEEFKLL